MLNTRLAILVGVLSMGLLSGHAHASAWVVNSDAGELTWSVGFNDATLLGRFHEFSCEIVFDPDDLANAATTVTVAIASVSADTEEQAQELVKPEWFDAATFANATFTADRFDPLGGDDYEVIGTLTIRDQTHPIAMPITFAIDGDTATITGETTINRIDFGVGQGDWSIDDVVGFAVTIGFSLTARRGD